MVFVHCHPNCRCVHCEAMCTFAVRMAPASFLKVQVKETVLEWGDKVIGGTLSLNHCVQVFCNNQSGGTRLLEQPCPLTTVLPFPQSRMMLPPPHGQTCHPCADMQSPWLTCQSMGGTVQTPGSTLTGDVMAPVSRSPVEVYSSRPDYHLRWRAIALW